MRRHLAALALLTSLAAPVPASAGVIITEGSVTDSVPSNNDFQARLLARGYDRYTSTGASLFLTTDSVISFYILGSESGNLDSFFSGANGFSEDNVNHFNLADNEALDGLLKFSQFFSAGNIASGAMGFTGGAPANLGQAGFGIFMKEGWVSGSTEVNRFIIGYDDQITGLDDDNHDDLMVLAVVRSVPEPGTWATLLLGFGALGAMMRRKSKAPRVRAAIA